MIRKLRTSCVISVLTLTIAFAFASSGCNKEKSSSGDSGKSDSSSASGSAGGAGGGPSQVTGVQREAQDAAAAEVARHWVKGADGWTTARSAGTSFAPDKYLRQVRDLTVEHVEPFDLSDTDKLNGFEWAGEVAFKQAPAREVGDPGIAFEGLLGVNMTRRRGQWTPWADYHVDSIRVQKMKGKWQVSQDNNILRGTLPTPADFATAGVK